MKLPNLKMALTKFVLLALVAGSLGGSSFREKETEKEESEMRERSPITKRALKIIYNIYALDHYIELVEKIERHPTMKGKSVKEICNSIRKLGYDSSLFTTLLGPASSLPSGVLNSDEMGVLRNMIAHSVTNRHELGVVRTPAGNVAMGHVMTGICAGLNRQKSVLLKSFGIAGGLASAILNLKMDNLFVVTISGDLGQTALENKLDSTKPLLGPGGSWQPSKDCPEKFVQSSAKSSEATDAELLGDIDGFLIGHKVEDWAKKGVRLGQLLRMYYSSGVVFDTSYRSCNRHPKFTALVKKSDLEAEVKTFAYLFKLRNTVRYLPIGLIFIPGLATKVTNDFFTYHATLNKGFTCPKVVRKDCELTANIMFVMDESGSIGSRNYLTEKDFIKRVIKEFDISPLQTRVGIIEYASRAGVSIEFEGYGSKTRLLCAMDKMTFTSGGTATHLAINLAKDRFLKEQNKKDGRTQILIVLTDGHSNSFSSLQTAVRDMKNKIKDLTTIAVGIGGFNKRELDLIATDKTRHVFTTRDFRGLIKMVETLRNESCNTPVQVNIDKKPDQRGRSTVVINSGFLFPGNRKYFKIPGNVLENLERLTIEIKSEHGKMTSWLSRTNRTPGPKSFTWRILPGESPVVIINNPCPSKPCKPVYIAIEGGSPNNECTEPGCIRPDQIKFKITTETTDSFFKKCNGVQYIAENGGCCNGEHIYSKDIDQCCFNQYVWPIDWVCYPRCGNDQYHPAFSGCCKKKVYSLSDERCCFGRYVRSRSMGCVSDTCGGANFDPNDSGCCNGKLFKKPFNQCCFGRHIQRAGGTCHRFICEGQIYDNLKQGCCKDKLYDRDVDKCCSGTYTTAKGQNCLPLCGSKDYDPAKERCCSSVLVWPKGINCPPLCGNKPYNPTNQTCCSNTIYTKRQSYFCCGNKYYDSRVYYCCLGKTLADRRTQSCCYPGISIPRGQRCPLHCGGKFYSSLNYSCCFNTAYRHQSKMCCFGRYIVDQDRGCLPRCGSTDYDPSTESCCNGMPYVKDNQQCCSRLYVMPKVLPCLPACKGKIYIPFFSICCNGKTESAFLFQCCPGDLLIRKNRSCPPLPPR